MDESPAKSPSSTHSSSSFSPSECEFDMSTCVVDELRSQVNEMREHINIIIKKMVEMQISHQKLQNSVYLQGLHLRQFPSFHQQQHNRIIPHLSTNKTTCANEKDEDDEIILIDYDNNNPKENENQTPQIVYEKSPSKCVNVISSLSSSSQNNKDNETNNRKIRVQVTFNNKNNNKIKSKNQGTVNNTETDNNNNNSDNDNSITKSPLLATLENPTTTFNSRLLTVGAESIGKTRLVTESCTSSSSIVLTSSDRKRRKVDDQVPVDENNNNSSGGDIEEDKRISIEDAPSYYGAFEDDGLQTGFVCYICAVVSYSESHLISHVISNHENVPNLNSLFDSEEEENSYLNNDSQHSGESEEEDNNLSPVQKNKTMSNVY